MLRRTRKRYAAALALVAALSVATVAAVSPVSAADLSEPLALHVEYSPPLCRCVTVREQ